MRWTGYLICFAVARQNLELWFNPPPSWGIVAREFPACLVPFVKYHRATLVVGTLAAAVALIRPSAPAALAMALTTWSTAARWRGTYNGGSDRMSFVISLATAWALARPADEPLVLRVIGLETCLSYSVAGVAKFIRAEWRSGHALTKFVPALARSRPVTLRALAWAILIFECTFPLALVRPGLAVVYLTVGFAFHLINAYALRLNRFFFAWVAAYPAVWALARY